MFRIVEDVMPPLPDDCSEALQDFLQHCFRKDPLQRPDAETLCEHPWLKMNWDALKVKQLPCVYVASLICPPGAPSSG